MHTCTFIKMYFFSGFRLLKDQLQDQWTQITTNSDILFEHIVLPLIDIKYIFNTSDKNADIYRKYIEIYRVIQSSQYKHGSTWGNIAENVIKNMPFTPFAHDTTSYMCLVYNAFKIGTASNKLCFREIISSEFIELYRSCSQLLKNATLSKEDMTAFLELCFVSFLLPSNDTQQFPIPSHETLAYVNMHLYFSIYGFSNQDKNGSANAMTTTNYTLNNIVVPYGISPSRIGTLVLFRTNSTQNSLVPFGRPRSIQNDIISLQAYRISTTLPCYLLLAIGKDESSGVPRLFTRYWIVTPDMFEDPLRASQLSTFTLSYIVFHPNDVRLPIYIPVYQGSYLNRKDTDYRQAYS